MPASPPTPTRTATRPPTGPPTPARRARRPLRVALAVAAALAGAALLLPVAANAAVSTFAAHDHGTLDIVIDGETVDLDQPRFRDLHPEFHVHGGHGNLWHHHPESLGHVFRFEPLTLRQALAAIGIESTATSFAFDGAVPEAATFTVTVNGAPVDPDSHVIADGDDITVVVVTR